MDYHQFFYDSLSIILQAFQEYIPNDYITALKKKYQTIVTPHKSIYVEIFAYYDNKRSKIQQWKFKPKGQNPQTHLQRSYSQQNSNDDSELSFSELNQPTFFKTLENIRQNIKPQLLLKKMERPKIICQIKDNQTQLIPFQGGNTFYYQVSEYQTQLFQVKLSFKYNYEDEIVAQELNEIKQMRIIKESDSDDFQLLVDQSYERSLIKLVNNEQNIQPHNHNQDKVKQGSSNSNKVLTQRKFSQIIQVSNKHILQTKQQRSQSDKLQKTKKQQQLYEIQRLFKNIDFSTVQSSKYKTFIEYLL